MDMDNASEFHYLQFPEHTPGLPASISILIRHADDRTTPLTDDDLLDVHEELQRFEGSITPLLK